MNWRTAKLSGDRLMILDLIHCSNREPIESEESGGWPVLPVHVIIFFFRRSVAHWVEEEEFLFFFLPALCSPLSRRRRSMFASFSFFHGRWILDGELLGLLSLWTMRRIDSSLEKSKLNNITLQCASYTRLYLERRV